MEIVSSEERDFCEPVHKNDGIIDPGHKMLIRWDYPGSLGKSILVLVVVLINACTTVPVTGRHQFMLIPEREAIAASVPAYF